MEREREREREREISFFCVDECELSGKERDTKGVIANGKMLLCTNTFTEIVKNN